MRNMTKEFNYEDNTYCFETSRFRNVIKAKVESLRIEGKKITKQELVEDIADAIGCSSSSVNHWYMGHNAPNDFEKILDLVRFLNLELDSVVKRQDVIDNNSKDEKKNEEVKEMMADTIRQIDYNDEKSVARDIYWDMIDFIEDFRNTIAFHYEDQVIDYKVLNINENIDALYNADQKYNNILIKIKKAMLDIPYELFNKLELFTNGYLEDCMGNEDAFIWEIGKLSDDELIERGIDLADLNPYGRRFEGFTSWCKNNDYDEEDLSVRIDYVNMIADNAYVIMEEIFEPYLRK